MGALVGPVWGNAEDWMTMETRTNVKDGPPPGMFKTGELARRTDTTRQNIHIYTMLGILTPEGYSKGGQKWYGEAAVQRIHSIRVRMRAGATLAEIRDALEGMAQETASAELVALRDQTMHCGPC